MENMKRVPPFLSTLFTSFKISPSFFTNKHEEKTSNTQSNMLDLYSIFVMSPTFKFALKFFPK